MICKYWINWFLDWALPSNPLVKYRIKCLCWQVDCLSLISLNPIRACKLKKVLFVLFVCYGQHLRRNIHSKKHGHYHRCALAAIMAGSPIHVAMPRTLETGLMSASSTKHLPAFSDPTSIVFHHFCQPVGHTNPALTLI